MNLADLAQNIVCGGLAAAGFGVLFNTRGNALPLCAASGAFALAVRTIVMERGWSMEGATFVAALMLGLVVQLFPWRSGVSRVALHVVGCIPMLPGGFAVKAIVGLFGLTSLLPVAADQTISDVLVSTIRSAFIVGALGTGLAIPQLMLPRRAGRSSRHNS